MQLYLKFKWIGQDNSIYTQSYISWYNFNFNLAQLAKIGFLLLVESNLACLLNLFRRKWMTHCTLLHVSHTELASYKKNLHNKYKHHISFFFLSFCHPKAMSSVDHKSVHQITCFKRAENLLKPRVTVNWQNSVACSQLFYVSRSPWGLNHIWKHSSRGSKPSKLQRKWPRTQAFLINSNLLSTEAPVSSLLLLSQIHHKDIVSC